jgi:hypothetical protein
VWAAFSYLYFDSVFQHRLITVFQPAAMVLWAYGSLSLLETYPALESHSGRFADFTARRFDLPVINEQSAR